MDSKFTFREKIGSGGMAEVFRAEISGPGGFIKSVAIKRLKPWLTDEQNLIDMFVDEARILSGLSHPNIVQVHHFEQVGKEYLLVMEYVHGRSLAHLLKRCHAAGQAPALSLVAFVAAETARGLAHAHAMTDGDGKPLQIIHRDVSPDNILLSMEGHVKVVDFGIAKAADRITKTALGRIKGKFFYMAPERLRDRQVDARTDLFSLGLVMHETLTGKRLLERATEREVFAQIHAWQGLTEKDRPKAVPDGLWEIMQRSLDPSPTHRYQNAERMAEALSEFREGLGAQSGAAELAAQMRSIFPEMHPSDADEVTDPTARSEIPTDPDADEPIPTQETGAVTMPERPIPAFEPAQETPAPPILSDEDGFNPTAELAAPSIAKQLTIQPSQQDEDEEPTLVSGLLKGAQKTVKQAKPLPALDGAAKPEFLAEEKTVPDTPLEEPNDDKLDDEATDVKNFKKQAQRKAVAEARNALSTQATALDSAVVRINPKRIKRNKQTKPWLLILIFLLSAVIATGLFYLVDPDKTDSADGNNGQGELDPGP